MKKKDWKPVDVSGVPRWQDVAEKGDHFPQTMYLATREIAQLREKIAEIHQKLVEAGLA